MRIPSAPNEESRVSARNKRAVRVYVPAIRWLLDGVSFQPDHPGGSPTSNLKFISFSILNVRCSESIQYQHRIHELHAAGSERQIPRPFRKFGGSQRDHRREQPEFNEG